MLKYSYQAMLYTWPHSSSLALEGGLPGSACRDENGGEEFPSRVTQQGRDLKISEGGSKLITRVKVDC